MQLVAPFAKLNTFQVSGSSNPNVDLGNETAPPAATESHLRLLREEKHCDVTFVVGPSEERIQCHQIFLQARSPVFETMFSERWSEGSSEIQIPDVDPKTFRAFLEVSDTGNEWQGFCMFYGMQVRGAVNPLTVCLH